MAIVNNKFIGYLDRSYEQVKSKLISKLPPEITDHSEGHILIIILNMFASISESINYYIDALARESFLSSARRYASVIGLVSVLDFRVRANTAESVDVEFTLDIPATVGGVIIPQGTTLGSPGNSNKYLTTMTAIIPESSVSVRVPAMQFTRVVGILIGSTTGIANQKLYLPGTYLTSSLTLEINGTIYSEVDSFALAKPADPVFIVSVNRDKIIEVTLGDGVTGYLEFGGYDIVADYSTTAGVDGRVAVGSLTQIESIIIIPPGSVITANNPQNSSGGSSIPDVAYIKRVAPLSITTLKRAVSRDDFSNLALLYPGVLDAKVHFCCGHTVDIYIAPEAGVNGGIASTVLLAGIKAYFEDKRLITKKVNPLAAGLSQIKLQIYVTVKFRKDPVKAKTTIESTLLTAYNYTNSYINRPVRVSDILSLVDNLDMVDFVDLGALSIIPYAEPRDHTVPLLMTCSVISTNMGRVEYKVTKLSVGYALFRENALVSILQDDMPYTDSSIAIVLHPSTFYATGNEWVFIAYPYSSNITIDNYSVPLLISPNLEVSVTLPTNNTISC